MTARELRAATGSVGLGWEAIIAAALRESAAEAFEEAAKRAARSISDGSESVEELPNELEVKAAMLRSTTRGRV